MAEDKEQLEVDEQSIVEDREEKEMEPVKEDTVENSPFTIDFINKKIRTHPSAKIGSTSRTFLKLRPEFYPSGTLDGDTTATDVPAGSVETTMGAYTIPANTISINDTAVDNAGNTFIIWASGTYTAISNGTDVTLRCKVGSTEIHALNYTGASLTNAPWRMRWTMMMNAIGSSGTFSSYLEAATNNLPKDAANTGYSSIDTTIDNIISVTGEISTGGGNIVRVRQFLVQMLN